MQLQKFREQYQKSLNLWWCGKEQATFWGCEGFLPEFSQTCPKKKLRLPKQSSSCCFEHRWPPFLLIFSGFARIFREFMKVFRDFAQISTDFPGFSTDPRLLHQWCSINSECYDKC